MTNPGQPTLQNGDTGDAVRRLQRALNRAPELLPSDVLQVDGSFGSLTEKQVNEFQQLIRSLVVDSIVGPKTWQALPDGGAMPVLSEGKTGGAVYELQRVLNWYGGAALVQDGIFGNLTRSAVMNFQAMAAISQDGTVGDNTWRAVVFGSPLERRVGLQYEIG